jgi:hypothetical protein
MDIAPRRLALQGEHVSQAQARRGGLIFVDTFL